MQIKQAQNTCMQTLKKKEKEIDACSVKFAPFTNDTLTCTYSNCHAEVWQQLKVTAVRLTAFHATDSLNIL